MNNPKLSRYVIPDMPSADELLPFLRQIDANRWYSNFGPLVSDFEAKLSLYLNTHDANPAAGNIFLTALMTCYHALQIGLQVFHLPEDANVLVPAVTFPACPLAVRHAGLTPVFADVDPVSWQLTPAVVRLACQKMSISAVMPVAVYGVPVPVAEWDAFMEETGIPVIIDAAAAFEAQPVPQNCLLAHSFHATKPFAVGEGGILVSRRPEWINEARIISNFGTVNRISVRDGSNAKMSEYPAAVGLAQLLRWEGIKKRRRDVFALYRAALGQAGCTIKFQKGVDQIVVSALMLETAGQSALEIVRALNEKNVAAHRMYLPPLYSHNFFSDVVTVSCEGAVCDVSATLAHKAKLMVNSENMNRKLFGLPFHAFLTEKEISEVVGQLAILLK